MSTAKMEQVVAISDDRSALDRVARPHTALAIWWRRLPTPLQIVLEAVDLQAVADIQLEMEASDTVRPALCAARYPLACAAASSADIDLLVRRQAALTGEDRLPVRLAVADADAGSRFQAEHGTFRLLCTYIGQGTQWCCVNGQDAICEVPTGSVGVFKGLSLLDAPVVLRRTPPISDLRLVLTIDPVPSC